jgi:TatD DNase family protein
MKNFIVDSHCHLDLIEQKGLDIVDIIENAQEKDVKILQTICTKITEFKKIYSYTQNFENIFCSVGVHPNNVDIEPKFTAKDIIKICQENKKVIGIGETGLDYFYQEAKKENQQESLIEHIKASQKTKLPLIIHNRDSDEDMAKILQQEYNKKSFNGLLHCFSSSEKLALCALEIGFYISISGIVTFKNAQKLRDIIKKIPFDRLLVETDAPYLAPTPYRGKINQPSYIKNTLEMVAKIKEISFDDAKKITTENFFRLFSTKRMNF